jgi:hypothetical protein
METRSRSAFRSMSVGAQTRGTLSFRRSWTTVARAFVLGLMKLDTGGHSKLKDSQATPAVTQSLGIPPVVARVPSRLQGGRTRQKKCYFVNFQNKSNGQLGGRPKIHITLCLKTAGDRDG